MVSVPHCISNFLDRHISGGQQVRGMSELAFQEHMAEMSACFLLEQSPKMGCAQVNFKGQLADGVGQL
ncbi:MAG TPA: hypothetical protein VKL99_11045 [Candidatus Angelobacter sp.]|nr:hypothetical protein [Candidatus Angelobacter sp.]